MMKQYLPEYFQKRCGQLSKGISQGDQKIPKEELTMGKFFPLIKRRLDVYQNLTSLHRSFNDFLNDDITINDQKWIVFKLMLSFDLFGLLDILYLNSYSLHDYIDRFYKPFHYTSLRNYQGVNGDDPESMVDEIVDESFRKTRLSYLLQIVIGHHIDIKQESLVSLHFNEQKALKKYEIIQKLMKEIQTIILKIHMGEQDFNDEILNDQNQFLKLYSQTTDEFKANCENFRLLLNYQELLIEFQETNSIYKNKRVRDQRSYEIKSAKIIRIIQTLVQKFKIVVQEEKKEVSSYQKKEVGGQQKKMTREEKKKAAAQKPKQKMESNKGRSEEEYEGLIKIFFAEYKQNQLQTLQLLKLSIVKYMFQKLTIRHRDLGIFKYFFKLKLFSSEVISTLWNSLGQPIFKLIDYIQKSHSNKQIEFSLSFYRQCQDLEIRLYCEGIDKIFKQADLLIASEICVSWREKTEISDAKKILVIGETKAGKSSLFNFLNRCTGSKKMDVGATQQSRTFYPKSAQIQIGADTWEWWDLPGLMDTRSFVFRLCIGYFLKTVVESSKQCELKFVYVHRYGDIFKIQSYPKLVSLFGNLLNWELKGIKSLSVVFTRISNRQESQELYQQEKQGMMVTGNKRFIENIKPVLNLDKKDIEYFFGAFCQHVFENVEYFTTEDNKKHLEDRDNRDLIKQLIHSTQPIQNLKVEPKVFLVDNESKFIQQFNIEYRAKEYLDPQNQQPQQLFLRLFYTIRTFRNLNQAPIMQQFEKIKGKLANQYKFGIHDNFVRLNKLNSAENKDPSLKENTYSEILRYHLKYYFSSFKQILSQQLKTYKLNVDLLQKVVSNTQKLRKDEQSLVNTKKALSTLLDKSVTEDNKLQIINKMTQQAVIHQKYRLDQNILLLAYLQKIIEYKHKDLNYVISNDLNSTNFLEGELKHMTTLKEEYKSVFLEKTNLEKFNRFIVLNKDNSIQIALLRVIEEIVNRKTKKNNSSYLEPHVMIEHFLQMLSKDNYETNLLLVRKHNQLFPHKPINNMTKCMRLNFYGQCVHTQIRMSQFLEINTIKQLMPVTKQSVYVFSQHSYIKVFCSKFIFDVKDIMIQCRDTLSIVAGVIQFQEEGENSKGQFSLQAVKFNDQPATIILVMVLGTKAEKAKVKENLRIPAIPTIANIPEGQVIETIVKFGVLVSRTAVDNGLYLELYHNNSNFIYNIDKGQGKPTKREILRRKLVTTSRPLEFGQLHLKRLVQEKLKRQQKKLRLEQKQLSTKESDALSKCCKYIIEFIKEKFQRTTIRLKYEHFNTIFCDNLSLVLVESAKDPTSLDLDVEQVKHTCYRVMKQLLFTHIYTNIMSKLESDYNRQYGRHIASRKLQGECSYIKKECEKLLELPFGRFQMQNQSDNLDSLIKKFRTKFQKNLFYFIQERTSIGNFFLSLFHVIIGVRETEQDIKQKLGQDLDFVDNEINKLIKDQMFFVNEQINHEQPTNNAATLGNISVMEQYIEITDTTLDKHRYYAKELCKNFEFVELINKYQTDMSMFKGKQDLIHSQIGYAYLQNRQYQQAENEFKLLPSEIENSDTHKIIFDVLKRKHESIYTACRGDPAVQNSKKGGMIEKEIYQGFKSCFENEPVSSLKRYNQRDRQYFNILSFDSAKFKNYIVNILFAAEIEKCTRRPIMHMFDMIVCKNSSALIGAALAIPRRIDREEVYGVKLYPQFTACQFIIGSYNTHTSLDDQMTIKTNFKPSEYDFRSLYTTLAIVNQVDNAPIDITTTFNYANRSSRQCCTIYDIVLKTVKNSRKEQEVNPLVDVYKPQFIPALKSNRKIGVLSLGTGTLFKDSNKEWQNPNCWRQDRWQLYLDNKTNMNDLSVQSYIQLARIWLQERWINKTKQMRDLMDRLEDKTTIKNLKL